MVTKSVSLRVLLGKCVLKEELTFNKGENEVL